MKALIVAGLAVVLLASCKKEAPMPPATPPPVENPAPPPAPKPQTTTTTVVTPPVPEKEKDGTAVSIGADGISVKNKKGEKENNVILTKEKSEITVKSNK